MIPHWVAKLTGVRGSRAAIINGGTNRTVRANIDDALVNEGVPRERIVRIGQAEPWGVLGIPRKPMGSYTDEDLADVRERAILAGRRAYEDGLDGLQLDWDVVSPTKRWAEWIVGEAAKADSGTAPVWTVRDQFRSLAMLALSQGGELSRETRLNAQYTYRKGVATLGGTILGGILAGMREAHDAAGRPDRIGGGLLGGLVGAPRFDPCASVWGDPYAKNARKGDPDDWFDTMINFPDAYSSASLICATVYDEESLEQCVANARIAVRAAVSMRAGLEDHYGSGAVLPQLSICVRALEPRTTRPVRREWFVAVFEAIADELAAHGLSRAQVIVFLWESLPWSNTHDPELYRQRVMEGVANIASAMREVWPAAVVDPKPEPEPEPKPEPTPEPGPEVFVPEWVLEEARSCVWEALEHLRESANRITVALDDDRFVEVSLPNDEASAAVPERAESPHKTV